MREAVQHRGTEDAEIARRKTLCHLYVLCVSVVNSNSLITQLKLRHRMKAKESL
jgi:hypothetical protein